MALFRISIDIFTNQRVNNEHSHYLTCLYLASIIIIEENGYNLQFWAGMSE